MDSFTDHVAGDLLKRYASDQLAASKRLSIEKHLLICPDCRARFTQETSAVALRDPQADVSASDSGKKIYIFKTVRVYWSGGRT